MLFLLETDIWIRLGNPFGLETYFDLATVRSLLYLKRYVTDAGALLDLSVMATGDAKPLMRFFRANRRKPAYRCVWPKWQVPIEIAVLNIAISEFEGTGSELLKIRNISF